MTLIYKNKIIKTKFTVVAMVDIKQPIRLSRQQQPDKGKIGETPSLRLISQTIFPKNNQKPIVNIVNKFFLFLNI